MIVRCVPQPSHLFFGSGSREFCSGSVDMEHASGSGAVVLNKPHRRDKAQYLMGTLAKDTAAFILTSCTRRDGYVITPLKAGERIYVIKDSLEFPVKFNNLVLKLRERGIWMVQSQLRATSRVNTFVHQEEVIGLGFATAYKHNAHNCPALSSLPNSTDDRQRTFESHRDESELCRLLLDHPSQLKRYVYEGIFYSGLHPPRTRDCGKVDVPSVQDESVFCSFCHCKTSFDGKRVSDYLMEKQSAENVESGAEAFLFEQNLHRPDCAFRSYSGGAMVRVEDAEGCERKTQMFFLFNPAQESDSVDDDDDAFSHKVCPYTRVFVVDTGQQSSSLFVSHEEMSYMILQQYEKDVSELRAMVSDVSEAFDNVKKKLLFM